MWKIRNFQTTESLLEIEQVFSFNGGAGVSRGTILNPVALKSYVITELYLQLWGGIINDTGATGRLIIMGLSYDTAPEQSITYHTAFYSGPSSRYWAKCVHRTFTPPLVWPALKPVRLFCWISGGSIAGSPLVRVRLRGYHVLSTIVAGAGPRPNGNLIVAT